MAQYVSEKYGQGVNTQSPIVIPDTRERGLTALWRDLGFTVGAEIGVEQGLFSEAICYANPSVRLYAVDAWREYARYENIVPQRKLNSFYDEAVARLRVFNAVVMRKSSLNAAQTFESESLDFVYIDANHELSHVIADIAAWSRVVKRGGIISGHDYRDEKPNHRIPLHVKFAVDAYTRAYRIHPWYIWRDDDGPSWMWEKA